MKITHVYHSCFLVELEHSLLLFDWYKRDLPVLPADKKLYVFCSHVHEDHYSEQIWDLQKTHPDITYILDEGIREAGDHPEADIVLVRPRQTYDIPADKSAAGPEDSIRIITLESTDMGVAFYIEAEGKRLYHAGDRQYCFGEKMPGRDAVSGGPNPAGSSANRRYRQWVCGPDSRREEEHSPTPGCRLCPP